MSKKEIDNITLDELYLLSGEKLQALIIDVLKAQYIDDPHPKYVEGLKEDRVELFGIIKNYRESQVVCIP